MRYIIASPAYYYTGGLEALHQLESTLRYLGYDASIIYYGKTNPHVVDDFRERLGTKIYDGDIANFTEDPMLILPETENPASWRAKGWRRIAVWWLAGLCKYPISVYKNCWHMFQSVYARDSLSLLGFRGPLLTDYIRDDIIDLANIQNAINRNGVIAVNHRSAGLAARWKSQGWVREVVLLAGMSTKDMFMALQKCEIFLDVGWHPGRDRMAREAALAGCLVIVNGRGASGNREDMPLAGDFIINDDNAEESWVKIDSLRQNKESHQMMDIYIKWVKAQKSMFIEETKQFVQYITFNAPNEINCADGLFQDIEKYIMILSRDLDHMRTIQSNIGSAYLRQCEKKTVKLFLARLFHVARRYFN